MISVNGEDWPEEDEEEDKDYDPEVEEEEEGYYPEVEDGDPEERGGWVE